MTYISPELRKSLVAYQRELRSLGFRLDHSGYIDEQMLNRIIEQGQELEELFVESGLVDLAPHNPAAGADLSYSEAIYTAVRRLSGGIDSWSSTSGICNTVSIVRNVAQDYAKLAGWQLTKNMRAEAPELESVGVV